MCNFTHTVCKFTQNIDLRCFVERRFLLQIYALLSVKFSGLISVKNMTNMRYAHTLQSGLPFICMCQNFVSVKAILKHPSLQFLCKLCTDCTCYNIWLLTAPTSFAVLWQQSRGEEGKWRNRWEMWKQTDMGKYDCQGSLLSLPLWQTQSQTPSPRGMGEVPRECWLQARRKRNRFASSSPIQNEDDVLADKVAGKR